MIEPEPRLIEIAECERALGANGAAGAWTPVGRRHWRYITDTEAWEIVTTSRGYRARLDRGPAHAERGPHHAATIEAAIMWVELHPEARRR